MERREPLLLRDAIAEFMAARDPKAPSAASYRTSLGRLDAAYPAFFLESFAPPQGSALVREHLEQTWGHRAASTYRAKLSNLHTFFEWHQAAGNLTGDPTVGLTYPAIERKQRRTITRPEATALLDANPDPRDQVPLRLLLTLGVQKDAIQNVRFRDLAHRERTVSFGLRGKRYTHSVNDDAFWDAVRALTDLSRPEPTDYVACAEVSRAYNATSAEFAAMEQTGWVDARRVYLWQRADGRWFRAKRTPRARRGEHGLHKWWYRCLERADLVPLGTSKGFPMQAARYTVGRRRWMATGSRLDLVKHMGGLALGGSAADVYRNRDSLDQAIRRVRRRVRLHRVEHSPAVAVDGTQPPGRWWKEPFRVFADYVEDERDLVELSRVSVEMLRSERATSTQLHDAVETLTRAVTPSAIVNRAEDESRKDHPLLHGHSVVAIWSALEAMIGDLVETWLMWWPRARTNAASSAPLSGPRGLPPDEWASSARQTLDREYQKLNRKTRSPRRLDYYEWLLTSIGLASEDAEGGDAQLARNLWEMQQIRNVFAHRRGVADARLATNSPHLPFKVGTEIRLGRRAWGDFLVSSMLYADTVARRMKKELGLTEWMRAVPAQAIRYGTDDERYQPP